MSEDFGNQPAPRSWRDIHQEVKPRAMSKSGRRRYALSIFNLVFACVFIGGIIWGVSSMVGTIEKHPSQVSQPPIRKLDMETDGVLTSEWVFRTLGITKTSTLLELNLDRIQDRLMASNQIRTVTLAKQLPATLKVNITERTPVVRILAEDGGSQRTLLVAKDGVVYEGECYDADFIAKLPWLEGVRLVRKNGRFAPIVGMTELTELLTKVRYESEHLYPLFQFVSLARLESDHEILVRSPECLGLVFSTKEDYFRQLAWLDYIRDTLSPSAEAPLQHLDLSNVAEGIVPVTLQSPPVAVGKGGAAQKAGSKTTENRQNSISSFSKPAPVADLSGSKHQTPAASAAPVLRASPQRPGASSAVAPAPSTSSAPVLTNPKRKSPQREL